MVKAVVVLVAVALGGCSFATMRTPHGSPPECTESTAAPVVDVLVAVASPFVAYAMLKSSDDGTVPDDQLRTFFRVMAAGAVSFPVWGTFGTSSIYGFVKAGRCGRAKRDYQQLMNAPPGPGMYAPPPIAPGSAPPPIMPASAPPPTYPAQPMYPAPPPGPMPAPAPAP